ncbi:Cna B-type domain-containing protein, partial [Streptococcus pneumoniae]
LPVSATLGGAAHEYTIKEVGETLNNISLAGKWYGVRYEGSMKEGFTITNKEKTPWAPMEIPTRDVKVTKEWQDSDGNKIDAPVDSVKVELYKDGVATGQVQELTKANNWTATFEKLPVSATLGGEAHQYTIKEVGEILNNIQVAGKWYGVRYEGSMKEGFTITNKEKTPWAPMEIPTRDVKVTKEWKDSAGNDVSAPVDSVKVELYKDGVATGQVQELTKANNWTAT